MLRGTAAGLEFVFAERSFDATWAEIDARLAERPDFYRGSRAIAIFAGDPPPDDVALRVVAAAQTYGITLRGFAGDAATEELAARLGVPYVGEPPRSSVTSFERKRAARADRAVELTERARSLDADFAGARADIASRRARGEASVPKPFAKSPAPPPPAGAEPPPLPTGRPAGGTQAPTTLYHRGTLRGGRALQQLGSIVVVGDVNPGAELVATGDIVVFGALRGTAHAGAQGDEQARVFALELAPTQLRIATFIATGEDGQRKLAPEVAFVSAGRIAIGPYPYVEVKG
jgi:septum site-determining protein MinC